MIATTEYERLRESAGLVDRSERGKLLLTGAEAAEYLQGQVTNDVESLAAGQGCYAALLTHKGKVIADMRVLRGADWIWLDTEPATLAALARNVDMYSIGRDVKLQNVTAERAILSLIGPAARAALEVQPGEAEHDFVEGEHGLYVTTDLGVDVICDASDVDSVRAALAIEPVDPEAAELVRLESGRPRHGIDFDADTIPQEAGLNERAVSFTKGCYVGQETVARLHYKGKPNRHLRGLRLSEPGQSGDEIVSGDKVVGHLGTVAVSPSHGPIALALVRREAAPGAEVEVGKNRIRGVVAEITVRLTCPSAQGWRRTGRASRKDSLANRPPPAVFAVLACPRTGHPGHGVGDRAARCLDGQRRHLSEGGAQRRDPREGGSVGRRPRSSTSRSRCTISRSSSRACRAPTSAAPRGCSRARRPRSTANPGEETYAPGTTERSFCGTHFCIHWVDTTEDAPTLADANGNGMPDYVETMLGVFENVYNVENVQMGWKPAKSDGKKGGNALVDVYIKNIGPNGIFGYAAPDSGPERPQPPVRVPGDGQRLRAERVPALPELPRADGGHRRARVQPRPPVQLRRERGQLDVRVDRHVDGGQGLRQHQRLRLLPRPVGEVRLHPAHQGRPGRQQPEQQDLRRRRLEPLDRRALRRRRRAPRVGGLDRREVVRAGRLRQGDQGEARVVLRRVRRVRGRHGRVERRRPALRGGRDLPGHAARDGRQRRARSTSRRSRTSRSPAR